MATTVGNLRAEDDDLHPAGSAANFNESMYFNFFDRAQWLGERVGYGLSELLRQVV